MNRDAFLEIAWQVQQDVEQLRLMLPDSPPEEHTERMLAIIELEAQLEEQIQIFNNSNQI